MTSVIMLFINFVLRVPLRMSEEVLLIGDDAVHGEDAYAFGDRRSHLYGDTGRHPGAPGDTEIGPMSVIQGETLHGDNGEISPINGKDETSLTH
jgi:ammonium transporter, Amt family